MDYTVAHYGILTTDPRLDVVLTFVDDATDEAASAWQVGACVCFGGGVSGVGGRWGGVLQIPAQTKPNPMQKSGGVAGGVGMVGWGWGLVIAGRVRVRCAMAVFCSKRSLPPLGTTTLINVTQPHPPPLSPPGYHITSPRLARWAASRPTCWRRRRRTRAAQRRCTAST